jgi:hypothetical protein
MPDKYQDEIEKILEGLGENAPTNAPTNSAGEPGKPARSASSELSTADNQTTRRGTGRRGPKISPGKLAVAGLLFLLLGAIIKMTWLIWGGLGLLVGAYLLFFVKPRSSSHDKWWRGQRMEDQPTSTWEQLKRWLKG